MQRLPAADASEVCITFEGRPLVAREGDSVAAALLAAGVEVFRHTPAGGHARAPYCMMGACFDCLVVIDGVPNRQACMRLVREGMRIERQSGAIVPAP